MLFVVEGNVEHLQLSKLSFLSHNQKNELESKIFNNTILLVVVDRNTHPRHFSGSNVSTSFHLCVLFHSYLYCNEIPLKEFFEKHCNLFESL